MFWAILRVMETLLMVFCWCLVPFDESSCCCNSFFFPPAAFDVHTCVTPSPNCCVCLCCPRHGKTDLSTLCWNEFNCQPHTAARLPLAYRFIFSPSHLAALPIFWQPHHSENTQFCKRGTSSCLKFLCLHFCKSSCPIVTFKRKSQRKSCSWLDLLFESVRIIKLSCD